IVPEKSRNDIEERLTEELAGLASSLADNPDGPARLAENMEAAKVYALGLVANGSASPENAARQAASAVVNDQFKFRDGIRIPSELDDDRMVRAMSEQKRLLAKSGEFVIEQLKFSTPEQAQADMRNLIDRSGYWITNENGTGVVLRIPHREGQGEVYSTDGRRVEYSWEDLLKIKTPERAEALAIDLYSNRGGR
ncbi:MAG TPA: hypothetical protein VFB62_20410, partial [Polyangiaceae bacterium]|nr:hypothetical protein [Polyangiaceae bacterium]